MDDIQMSQLLSIEDYAAGQYKKLFDENRADPEKAYQWSFLVMWIKAFTEFEESYPGQFSAAFIDNEVRNIGRHFKERS